jgi:hypothetical protein
MGVPGAIRNFTASGGNGGAFFSFVPPLVTDSNEEAISYDYYLLINGFPTLGILWIPPNSAGQCDIPYYDTLPAGTSIVMKITPRGVSGTGPEYTSTPVQTIGLNLSFTMGTVLSASQVAYISGAVLEPLSVDQLKALPSVQASDKVQLSSSQIDVSVKSGNEAISLAYAPVDPEYTVLAEYVDYTDTVVGTNSKYLTSVSVSATKSNGQALGNDITLSLDIPQLTDNSVIVGVEGYITNTDGTTTLEVNFSVTQGSNGITIATADFIPDSIYLIYIKTSSGATVTIPVENNQAYNDYLHDESGYQNRRENRLLTSGFYRGPVDSSTLTRIRSANGVLLGVPGVPGGMQGSRCCPRT